MSSLILLINLGTRQKQIDKIASSEDLVQKLMIATQPDNWFECNTIPTEPRALYCVYEPSSAIRRCKPSLG
jgi:hypothetical protein